MSLKKIVPACVGVILDGNRRWAKEQGLPFFEGHTQGYKNLKKLTEWCKEENIKHVVVYAFSTENWKRTEEEVGHLMNLLRSELAKYFDGLRNDEVAVQMVGNLDMLSQDIRELVQKLHETNPKNPKYHVWIAVSYGGRAEIVSAVNKLLKEGKREVDEEVFARALWTSGMPDPDIIIRTGGDRRLSNFLTWASVYSELFFVDTFWPAFTKEEFQEILQTFANRKRRYGV